MKKKLLIILIILIFSTAVYAASVKWSAMAANVAVADDDVMLLIDTGTGASQKITVLNLFDTIDTFAELNTITADKTLVNEEDAVTWDSIITFSTTITFSDAATIDQSANNYIDFAENGDTLLFYYDATDLGIIWSDGALNLQNAEDGTNAIVNIMGKDAGEYGVLRVLSDGDDKYIELYNDDTDAVLTNSAGNIIINPVGLGIVVGDNGDEDYTITFDGNTSDGVLNYDEDNADFEFDQDIATTGDVLVSGGNINTGAVALVVGDAATTSIQLLTDGTGDGEIAIPNDAIGDAEINWATCTLADFDFETAWKMWHSDAAGDVTEITLGANGTFLESNGAAANPAFRALAAGDIPDISATYQPLDATLTDIADGTIAENLVNTANPWADNEVADNITIDLATLATTVTLGDDDATNDNQDIVFTTDAAGAVNLEADIGDFYYNPSTGTVTATEFIGGGSGLTLASTDLSDTATLLYETELDSFAELDAQIADKALINLADGGTFTGNVIANGNLSVGNATTTAGVLTLLEDDDDGANFASFMVPALGANTVYTLPPDDGDNTEVLQTNGAGTLTWVANAGAGATDWDDIGDAGGDGTIDFGGTEQTITSTLDGINEAVLTIDHTDADVTNVTNILLIRSVDDNDPSLYYIKVQDNTGVATNNIFSVGADGDIATDGNLVAGGTITEGGVAVPNVNEIDWVAAAEMADADHGDVAWNGGDASVEAATIADSVYASCYVGIFQAATGADQPFYTDGALTYDASNGTLAATEFSGGGGSLTGIDAATGDSATAFFDAGTIEHEYGGLQANLAAYTGLIGITGADTTVEVDTSAEMATAITDETGSGKLTFATAPVFVTSVQLTGADADPAAAAGTIAYDSTIGVMSGGGLRWYDDNSVRLIVDLETDPSNDDYVVTYDAAADGFYMLDSSGFGVATAYDDIGDPDASGSISFDAAEGATYTSSDDQWVGVTISNTQADNAGDTELLTLAFTDNGDTNSHYLIMSDNAGDQQLEVIQSGGDIKIESAGDLIFSAGGSDISFGNENLATTGNVLFDGNLSVGNAGNSAGVLTLLEDDDDGANFASFMVPALGANTVYTLPPDDGDNTEVLQTNGGGTLTWVANAGSATAWDDITDPDIAQTIDFVTYTQTIDIGVTDDGGPKSGLILDVTGLGAGITDVVALEITTATDWDTDYVPMAIYNNSGADNDEIFKIDYEGSMYFGLGAKIYNTTANYIMMTPTSGSDSFYFYTAGTDCDILWTDGAMNFRNNEDGIDAIVNIQGKDANEKGILRVMSDGDDNYIELHHDDTDGHIITDTGDIHIEPAGGDVSLAASNLDTTGDVNFGGADLELPQASPAVPGVDGGVELDFTDGKMVIQHGAAHAELGGATDVVMGSLIDSWGGTIYAPDGVNDVITVKAINSIEFPHGVVITAVYLGVSEDSNYVLTVQNFDDFDTINAGNGTIDTVTYTADTTGEIIDPTPTYATIAAGQIIMISIPATDVDWIHFEIYFYEPAA